MVSPSLFRSLTWHFQTESLHFLLLPKLSFLMTCHTPVLVHQIRFNRRLFFEKRANVDESLINVIAF
jgi:hypothetical protein